MICRFIVILPEIIEHAARSVEIAVLLLALLLLTVLFRALFEPFLLLAAQALGLALVQQARKRLHRDRCEDAVHVHRELDLPVGLGGEGVLALVVGIDLGPLGN